MLEGFYPITDAVTRAAIRETGADATLLSAESIAWITRELNRVRPAGQCGWSHQVRFKIDEETHYLTLVWQGEDD